MITLFIFCALDIFSNSFILLILLIFIYLLLAVFIGLILFFTWYAFEQIVIVYKNYNYSRADLCNWNSCGLYFHNEKDNTSQECLNPRIPKELFEKLKVGGNQKGCKYSVKVIEKAIKRKPAIEYYLDYLERYRTFNAHNLWLKLISIYCGLIILILYLLGVTDIIALKNIF